MSNDKIRVGLVGANAHYGWSRRAHIPALFALPEYELTAVCTAHAETAAESARYFGARLPFHDYNEMAAHPDIDVVAVSVRAPVHYSVVMAALRAGKHVFCEWPLGANLREAEEMAELAAKAKVHHMVGLQARGDPALLRLKELLAEGYVGEVLACNMTMFRPGILQWESTRAWMSDAKLGGNTLSIGTGHAIDVVCFCVGEFKEVSGQLSTQVPEWEITDTGERVNVTSPDNVLVNGVLTNGAIASVHVATIPWHGTGWRMEVYGREGTLVASSTEMVQYAEIGLKGAKSKDDGLKELAVPERLTWVPSKMPKGEPFNVGQLYRRLSDAVRGTGSSDPDFNLAVKNHRLLETIQRSSNEKKPVEVAQP